MNKFYMLLGLFAICTLKPKIIHAQKLTTRSGHVWFYSHTPIEDIEAHNHQVMSIIDLKSGDIAFAMLMKGFQFEKALMQTHFNERYVESEKYPKSTYNGTITNFSEIDLTKNGEYDANTRGTLTIHGVSNPLEAVGKLIVNEEVVKVEAKFSVLVSDYEIKIPSVVADNIAKNIDIFVETQYEITNP